MEANNEHQQKGQSMVIIAIAVLVLLIFAVIAVDLAYGYVHRRGDQNAADAAALSGARALADIRNDNYGDLTGKFISEQSIQEAMNDFAERNGIEDTNNAAGDSVNTNVTGYYLAADGSRLQDVHGREIVIGEIGIVPWAAQGVEAIANSVAPSFFGGIVGLDGLPIKADAAVVFSGDVCSMGCIAPIATLTMTFKTGECYNIWDGSRQTRTIAQDYHCSNDPGFECTKHNECNFKKCEAGGTCQDNAAAKCKTDKDCNGICVGIQLHCSNSLLSVCSTDEQCDFGSCIANHCSQGPNLFCATSADCDGTCGVVGDYFGSQCYKADGAPTGQGCQFDEDCPEGQYCEERYGSKGSSSGLGWLNWSVQEQDDVDGNHSCQDVGEGSDCSTRCLEYNLQPETCLSGNISVGDWAASTSGVKNSSNVRAMLECYAGLEPGVSDPGCRTPGEPMTVIVYDRYQGTGCYQGQNTNKLQYHVVGFAKFDVLGYMLSQGGGSAVSVPGFNPDACIDWGAGGNRISGKFVGWVEGIAGDCDSNSTIVAPRVIK